MNLVRMLSMQEHRWSVERLKESFTNVGNYANAVERKIPVLGLKMSSKITIASSFDAR